MKDALLRPVWALCWPLLITYFLMSTIGLVDISLAGQIGECAQAAVGFGDQCLFLVVAIGTGLSVAISTMVAKSAGRCQPMRALQYALAGLHISILVGTGAVVIGVAAALVILPDLGGMPFVTKFGAPYVMACSPANLPFVVILALGAIFRAYDKPLYVLHMWSLTVAVSLIFSVILFHCPSPCLHHSLAALGLAWDLGALLGVLLGLLLFLQLKRGLEQSHNDKRTESRTETRTVGLGQHLCEFAGLVKEIASLAWPVVLTEMLSISASFAFFALLCGAPHNAEVQAAYSIFLKVEETVALVPLMTVELAAAVVVARHLGSGDAGQAEALTVLLQKLAAGAMFLVGLILCLLAPKVASCFVSQGEQVSSSLIILLSASPLCFPLMAMRFVNFAALEGAGRTTYPLLCDVAGNAVSISILALAGGLLPFQFGAPAISMAMIAGKLVKAASSQFGVHFLYGCFHAQPAHVPGYAPAGIAETPHFISSAAVPTRQS